MSKGPHHPVCRWQNPFEHISFSNCSQTLLHFPQNLQFFVTQSGSSGHIPVALHLKRCTHSLNPRPYAPFLTVTVCFLISREMVVRDFPTSSAISLNGFPCFNASWISILSSRVKCLPIKTAPFKKAVSIISNLSVKLNAHLPHGEDWYALCAMSPIFTHPSNLLQHLFFQTKCNILHAPHVHLLWNLS